MMRTKRCGILSVAATALVLAVCPGGARASQPAEATPQQIVNRLVQEPWTFEGQSDQRITLGQPSLYNGHKPARLLVGLRPQGQGLSGELVSLDAENRPLAAVPIRGAYTSSPTPDARAVPCRLIVDLPKPLTLDGTCGPGGLAGRFHNAEKALPLMFVAPDLYGRHTTEGTYWLQPRRS